MEFRIGFLSFGNRCKNRYLLGQLLIQYGRLSASDFSTSKCWITLRKWDEMVKWPVYVKVPPSIMNLKIISWIFDYFYRKSEIAWNYRKFSGIQFRWMKFSCSSRIWHLRNFSEKTKNNAEYKLYPVSQDSKTSIISSTRRRPNPKRHTKWNYA